MDPLKTFLEEMKKILFWFLLPLDGLLSLINKRRFTLANTSLPLANLFPHIHFPLLRFPLPPLHPVVLDLYFPF